MINLNRVKTVIDQWDPLDLLSNAPKDEYDEEIKRIMELTSEENTVES